MVNYGGVKSQLNAGGFARRPLEPLPRWKTKTSSSQGYPKAMPSHIQQYIMKHILNLHTCHRVACQTYLPFSLLKLVSELVEECQVRQGHLCILREHHISVPGAKAKASPQAIEEAFAQAPGSPGPKPIATYCPSWALGPYKM